MKETNLVMELAKLLKKYFDSPWTLCYSSAISMSSTIFGPLFDSKFVGVYGKGNTYIVLSTIPGRTRRSTIQSAFNYIFKKVYYNELLQIEMERNIKRTKDEKLTDIKLKKKIQKMVNKNMLIQSGSREGVLNKMMKVIDEDYKNISFVFNSKEFGPVLKNIFNENSYEKGLGIILSNLFYGEDIAIDLSERGGKSSGYYIPEGTYACVFAGMQKMKHYVSKASVTEGLSRRILVDAEKSTEHKDPINLNREDYYPDLDKFVEKVIAQRNRLRKYLKTNQKMLEGIAVHKIPDTIDVFLDKEVQDGINAISAECDKAVDKNPSMENITRQSDWEHVFRIALCYEIAETKPLLPIGSNNSYCVQLSKKSYKFAKKFVNEIKKHIVGQYNELEDTPKRIDTLIEVDEKLYSKIVEGAGIGGYTSTQLMQKLGWSTEDLTNISIRLVKFGRAYPTIVATKTKKKTVWLPGKLKEVGVRN